MVGGGRCAVCDTWFQTETGGHMIVNLPAAWTEKPGSGGCLVDFYWFGLLVWGVWEGGGEAGWACRAWERRRGGPRQLLKTRCSRRAPPRPAATLPFFGVQPCICDDKGKELKGEA